MFDLDDLHKEVMHLIITHPDYQPIDYITNMMGQPATRQGCHGTRRVLRRLRNVRQAVVSAGNFFVKGYRFDMPDNDRERLDAALLFLSHILNNIDADIFTLDAALTETLQRLDGLN